MEDLIKDIVVRAGENDTCVDRGRKRRSANTEDVQKDLRFYKEQVKFYSDFVFSMVKDYNILFEDVKKLRQAVEELKGVKHPAKATMIPLKGGKYGK